MSKDQLEIIRIIIKLFADKGMVLSLPEIARHTDITDAELSSHFESREALFDDIYFFIAESVSNETMAYVNLRADSRKLFCSVWMSYIRWAFAHQDKFKVAGLLKTLHCPSHDVRAANTHLFALVYERLEKDIAAGAIVDLPIQYICDVAAAHMRSHVVYAIVHDYSQDQCVELAEQGFEMFWRGILRS